MRRHTVKILKALKCTYETLLILLAVLCSAIILAAAFLILRNNPQPSNIFGVFVWVLWFMSLICAIASFNRLHTYLKNEKKHLYETLERKNFIFPFDSFPFMLLNYRIRRLLKYMLVSDSHDDKKSLWYKNLWRISVASFIVLFFLFRITGA